MATKKVELQKLLQNLDTLRQLVITWVPGKSRPVTVLYIKANDELVTHDKLITDSPALFRLGDPVDGQYTITWAISPEVKVNGMAMTVVRPSTGARTVVETVGAKDRGDLWSNSQGVPVNAP